jgi:hypothetical protein
MPRAFGYSEKTADAAKTRIDRDQQSVDHYLDRLARTVPQAGGITSRLDEAKEIVQGVVGDLHEEIDRRTEVSA